MNRALLVYVDPGFLGDIGHYRTFADNIRREVASRNWDLWHMVASAA